MLNETFSLIFTHCESVTPSTVLIISLKVLQELWFGKEQSSQMVVWYGDEWYGLYQFPMQFGTIFMLWSTKLCASGKCKKKFEIFAPKIWIFDFWRFVTLCFNVWTDLMKNIVLPKKKIPMMKMMMILRKKKLMTMTCLVTMFNTVSSNFVTYFAL